ncbi:MAG: galactokinase family protein [Bacilli bacterium]
MDKLIESFKKIYRTEPKYLIDTGGRFEICGNHTDHNHGLCLVANCSLRISAAISEQVGKVSILSDGYPFIEFTVNDLEVNPKEYGTTMGLCKGVLFKLKELGYHIDGFKAFFYSDIPNGSGVSSSAAVESLFGYIISYLYNNESIPPLTIAKVGQFAENVYFHKPCGLLDQIGTSFDSSNYIDFKDIENPIIKTIPFNLPVTLYLIKSLGNHSNLTPLYAAIPTSMNKVAELLEGKKYLRDCDDTNIFERINKLKVKDKVKRKAIHFFIENKNVENAKKAIIENNVEDFLNAIRASQESSKTNLENTFVKGEYNDSPQDIIDKATIFLKDNGAIRIHGGGFKGTTLAFVKNEFTGEFDKYLKETYTPERYFKVHISDKAVNFKKI